jgi:hypothetical protein
MSSSSFEKLVTIVFEHDYFSQQGLTALDVTVLPDSRQSMLNYGLVFKRLGNGFSILYDTVFAGRQRAKDSLLQENIRLSFSLALNDAHFYNYTGLSLADIAQSIFYFRNDRPLPADNQHRQALHAGEWVSEKDLRAVTQFKKQPFIKPFGWLDLELHQPLPAIYYVRFPVKQTFWQYIVVSDHLQGLDKLAVMDAQAKEVFKGPETITLPDNRRALSFISPAPIPLSQADNKIFQLVENYDPDTGKGKVVQAALPWPDMQVISSATSKRTGRDPFFSEIFIY